MHIELEQLTATATFHELTARVREDQTQLQTAADELLAALPSILQSRPLIHVRAVAWGNLLPRITPEDGLLLVVAWKVRICFPQLDWKLCVKLAAQCVHNAWGQTIETQRVESGVMLSLLTAEQLGYLEELPYEVKYYALLQDRLPEVVMRLFKHTKETWVGGKDKSKMPEKNWWKPIYNVLHHNELTHILCATNEEHFVQYIIAHRKDWQRIEANIFGCDLVYVKMTQNRWWSDLKTSPLKTGGTENHSGYLTHEWREYEVRCLKFDEKPDKGKHPFADLETATNMQRMAERLNAWIDDEMPARNLLFE